VKTFSKYTIIFFTNDLSTDLDCQIQRPKIPQTALPSDVRTNLGMKDRKRVLKPCNNISKESSGGLLARGNDHIKKHSFLKKGSRKGPLTQKSQIILHSQLFDCS